MEDTVVFYPSLGVSHLIPLVELAKLTVTHHPSFSVIILITTTTKPDNSTVTHISRVSSTTPAITFYHLPPLTLPSDSPSQFEDLAFLVPRLNNPYLHQALQTLSQNRSLRALVIDFFCTVAFEVSSSLNIPVYFFYASNACSLSQFLYFATIHETTTKSIKDLEVTHIEFPGVPPIPISDIPKTRLVRNTTAYRNFLNAGIQMAKSSGIIVNSFEAIHPRVIQVISDGLCVPNGRTPPVYCWPLIVDGGGDDDNKCLSWLDSQPSRSVVFLCFGSRGLFKAKQLKEIAIGLENSGYRFLWVVRNPPIEDQAKRSLAPSKPELDALLPEGFMDRTKDRGLVMKSWCPQAAVLSHASVGGFVTHCGWSSVQEAVRGGVPMLAWPLFGEQRLNRVVMVEEMKLALVLDESDDGFVSSTKLEKRVRELMDSDKARVVREQVMVMREALMDAVGENGSSRVALAKLVESWKRGRN